MPSNTRLIASLLTSLAILAFGVVYLLERPDRWLSTASVVLVPAEGEDQSSIIQSFGQSGTAGTVVEYLSGSKVWDRAGSPEGELAVRLVPDTRVIDLTLTGSGRTTVRRDLTDVVRAGVAYQAELGDPWRIRVLGAADVATRSGPTSALVAASTVLIALLAAIGVWVVLGRRPGAGARLTAMGDEDARTEADTEALRRQVA